MFGLEKGPFINTFPTHKTIQFEIMLVLDVPEGVKVIRLIESFRVFSNCKLFFDTHN